MHNEGDSVHVSEQEASGGSKENVVRWVLIIGTLLAVVALSIIWITGSMSSNPQADDVSVSDQIRAEQENSASVPIPPATPEPTPTVEDGINVIPNDGTSDTAMPVAPDPGE